MSKLTDMLSNNSLETLKISEPKYLINSATLQETVDLMTKFKIGSCLVIDDNVTLQGIITERDILMKVAGKNVDYDNSLITEYMTPNPNTLGQDATIYEAIQSMSEGRYRHIPITNSDNRPIGIISIKDVMDYIYANLKS